MVKRKISPSLFKRQDVASWNFIIFLTLAFILLVVVVTAMNKVGIDLRTRASNACPAIVDAKGQPVDEKGQLMRLESCPGGKLVAKRDANGSGCIKFTCELPMKK